MERTTTSEQIRTPSSSRLGAGQPRAVRRWSQFLAGLLGILLFAFGVIPALQRLEPVREVRDATRRAGVDASALFYTESDVSSEAEASIRNAMRYPVHRADHTGDRSRRR